MNELAAAQPAARLLAVVGLGLGAGLCFALPVLGMLLTSPGRGRTAMTVVGAIVAILVIRHLGARLRTVLDASPQPQRLPLLGVYVVAAMSLPAALLLFRLH